MENDQFEQRKEKLNELRSLGFNPFANGYRPDSLAGELSSRFAGVTAEELENRDDTFSLAGRVVGLRDFGKSLFFHIADRSGKIQAYIKKDVIGDEGLKFFKKYVDLGDFVGITGNLFKTRTGELTVNVKELRLLTKTLHPLPEKWHGLKD
ncbi:MAG TPA: OB-fold nucleic acid binding domain-containing protein, partial [Thermodesulfobacteriota bacterium]|nr:OB-fold nucleic acid binding domain-containing protein [Thermodesulfobacteriota bacterium]